METYNIVFNDCYDSNDLGFAESFDYCLQWIESNRHDMCTYFGDYKGGTVSIVCNETGTEVYFENIK